MVTGGVYHDEGGYAVYVASMYPHGREIWIDVIFGTWGETDFTDHVTFGCRVGVDAEHTGPMCSLVSAASVAPADAIYGERLDRDRALGHPWLSSFWCVVDLVLLEDPVVRSLYNEMQR